VLSTLCVERAVPLGGKPAEGHALETTLHRTLVSESAPLLTPDGVQPGAYLDMAEAALVTADQLAALGAPWCSTRLPAPSRACGGGVAEPVPPPPGAAGGGLPQPPPPPRPGPFDPVAAGVVSLDGKPYRAVGVPATRHAPRRPQRVEREGQAASPTR